MLKNKPKNLIFSNVSLSHQAVRRWIEEIEKSFKINLENEAPNLKFYVLVSDGSADATDMAQLALFVRDIGNKCNGTEEMAALVPLKGTTTFLDLYKALKLYENNFLWPLSTYLYIYTGILVMG